MNPRSAAGLAAGLLLAMALAFGVPALLVPGAALAVAVIASVVYVTLVARRTGLVRTPTSLTAIEGERVVLAVAVTGRGRLLRAGELAANEGAPFRPRRWLDSGSPAVTVTVGRRGEHELGPSTLRFRDPFGLSESRVRSAPTRVLALPRTERIPRSLVAQLRSGRAVRGRYAGALGDVDGVREAAAGVSASRVHWPTVARTGNLAERVITPEFDTGPLVVLDTRPAASRDELDAAVRAAGSLLLALGGARGGARLLVCDEPAAWSLDERLVGWPRIHARLATVARGRTLAWRWVQSAPVVIWVSPAPCSERPAGVRRGPDFVVAPGAASVVGEVCGLGVHAASGRSVA